MTLTKLPRVVPEGPGRPEPIDAAGFMRELTQRIATEAGAWTRETAAQMTSLFDSMASGWPARDRPERHDALRDALARGGAFPDGLCLEVGGGTGNTTDDLRAAFDVVVSIDLSQEMLTLASGSVARVRGDASMLPVRTSAVSVVALVNMFLFPAEVARVLRSDGTVLWVSTNGDLTPIYLSPEEVVEALPGSWHGVSAQAGWGTWLAARRNGS